MSKVVDIVGERYGRWVVLHREGSVRGKASWMCLCDCGNKGIRTGDTLRTGMSRSCGCLHKELIQTDITGNRYGRLVAVKRTVSRYDRNCIWECLCDCGKTHNAATANLKSGNVRSCGCLHPDLMSASRKWSDTKKAKRFWAAKRRSARKQQTPVWSDLESIEEFYNKCPDGMHVDHVVPLQGKSVSGLHVLNNLQYLTPSDNFRKSNTYEII